jgi:signal transduction histidine kinase
LTCPKIVSVDAGRISQLVSNLLGNALTHGDPKAPVRLGATARGGQLEVWVANAGPPIPAKAMERLFQPFFRGEVRASQQGLGLGLHIASEIARAHGGTLSVASDDTETRFTLRAQSPPPPRPSRQRPQPSPAFCGDRPERPTRSRAVTSPAICG